MTSASDGEIDIPLVVDLDGTLTLTDTLYESFVKFLFRNPAAAVAGVLHLARGPAAVKRYIAERCRPDPATLPYRADLIEMVKAEKARGRAVHLVTAADQSIADDVARHLGLFETAAGSDGRLNLKGPNKLAYLRKTFPGGFLYAGDGSADLPVFTGARGVVLCDVAAFDGGKDRGSRNSGRRDAAPAAQFCPSLVARVPRPSMGEEPPAVRAAVCRACVRRSQGDRLIRNRLCAALSPLLGDLHPQRSRRSGRRPRARVQKAAPVRERPA